MENEKTEIDYSELMATSERVSSGFKSEDYLDLDNLRKALEAFRKNRDEGNAPHILKKKVKTIVDMGILLIAPPNIEKASHFTQLKTFLGSEFSDEYGVKIFFSKGDGPVDNPDWIKFKDLWHESDPENVNPKAGLALSIWRYEKTLNELGDKVTSEDLTQEEADKIKKDTEKLLKKAKKDMEKLEKEEAEAEAEAEYE